MDGKSNSCNLAWCIQVSPSATYLLKKFMCIHFMFGQNYVLDLFNLVLNNSLIWRQYPITNCCFIWSIILIMFVKPLLCFNSIYSHDLWNIKSVTKPPELVNSTFHEIWKHLLCKSYTCTDFNDFYWYFQSDST